MNLNDTANKFASIFDPVSNNNAAVEIADELSKISESELKEAAIEDKAVGRVVFFKSDKHPGLVLEVVGGSLAADSVLTLYKANGIFSDRGAYARARIELLVAAAKAYGMGNYIDMQVFDPARGRKVRVTEIGTAQLIDVLNDSERRVIVR